MIEFLLLDLDDTILDFHRAERIALSRTLEQFGVEPTESILRRYHEINKWHWEQMELKKMERPQVLLGRFEMLFSELGRMENPLLVAQCYERNLSQGHFFLPGAEEALEKLHGDYRLFLVSNGTSSVQKGRMTSADLYRFFEKVFISQDIGFNKPSIEYFNACFAKIPDFDREKALIVGDSLSSDIRGGINAGIRTVWVNPEHKIPGDFSADYEIEGLRDLPALLGKINNTQLLSDGQTEMIHTDRQEESK